LPNKGVAPVDTNTAVGQFRVDVGDTDSVPLDPTEAGFADYTYFSDLELQSALDATGGVTSNAGMAFMYRKLAAILSLKAQNIQTDDLKYASEQRAEIMRKIAKDFQDAAENGLAATDIFDIFPTIGSARHNELAEWPNGCYGRF